MRVPVSKDEVGWGSWRDGSGVTASTTPAEDLNSVPRIHGGWLSTPCNSSSRGFDAPIWSLWTLVLKGIYLHTNTHNYQYVSIIYHYANINYYIVTLIYINIMLFSIILIYYYKTTIIT